MGKLSKNDFKEIGNPFVVVITSNKNLKDKAQVKFTDTPEKALNILKENSFPIAMVAGGGQNNSLFVEKGLVDEIYLDVEPLVFGKGIPLFSPADFEFKLELLGVKNLSKETIQLHYKVVK